MSEHPPPPPADEPASQEPPPVAWAGTPSDGQSAMRFGDPPNSDDKTWAMVAHLANLVAPALGPLIIYFMYKDKSRFVAYHALQATIFHAILFYVVSIVTCGLSALVMPILAIVWGLKAQKGEWTGYPLIEGVGR